jgi:penicillin-binding protein 1A
MTRAFAAVSARGTAIEPYGILKVTTTDGEVLYKRAAPRDSLLVPGYVAAGITDLLQSAVAIGTGKAAQIGRPVAGKTGTTSSNKDGWFIGFSSGITTGVWMGRDDAHPVPGLQGGTAPARAFAAYMRYAVAKRPVEQFETELKLPDWQLEPDDEQLQGNPNDYYYTDDQGNMIAHGGQDQGPGEPPVDRGQGGGSSYNGGLVPVEPPPAAGNDFLDQATGRRPRDATSPRAGASVPPPPRPGQPGSRERPIPVN